MRNYKRFIVAAIAVGAVYALVGTAVATPPSGQSVTLLGRGTFGNGLDAQNNHVEVERDRGSSDFVTLHLVYEPGGSSGWHHHPGVGLVTVVSGALTFYTPDCVGRTYTAGQSFVEVGNNPGLVRNEGSIVAEDYVTFIIPTKTLPTGLRIDDPQPAGCDKT
jgi:quercetin dioxygenase-like cupin family protein